MKSLRLSLTAAAVAGSLGLAADAAAQGFFERLFGLRPAQPVYPPQPIPQPRGPYGVPPGPAPYPGGAPPPEGELTGPSGPVAPPPPKPIVLKAPTEDSVIGRELKLNGGAGSLRLERTGRADLRRPDHARRHEGIGADRGLHGPRSAREQPIAAASQGRADGLPRYEVQAPVCPITFDVLDGAVLVKAPAEACVFQAGLPRRPAGHVGAATRTACCPGARHRGCARHRRQGRARELQGAGAEGRPARRFGRSLPSRPPSPPTARPCADPTGARPRTASAMRASPKGARSCLPPASGSFRPSRSRARRRRRARDRRAKPLSRSRRPHSSSLAP